MCGCALPLLFHRQLATRFRTGEHRGVGNGEHSATGEEETRERALGNCHKLQPVVFCRLFFFVCVLGWIPARRKQAGERPNTQQSVVAAVGWLGADQSTP